MPVSFRHASWIFTCTYLKTRQKKLAKLALLMKKKKKILCFDERMHCCIFLGILRLQQCKSTNPPAVRPINLHVAQECNSDSEREMAIGVSNVNKDRRLHCCFPQGWIIIVSSQCKFLYLSV